MIQSTEGSSKPSVSTAQLATTRVSPVCRHRRMARRVASGVVPSSASAGMPASRNVSAIAYAKATVGVNNSALPQAVRLKGGEHLRRGIGRKQQALQLGVDEI